MAFALAVVVAAVVTVVAVGHLLVRHLDYLAFELAVSAVSGDLLGVLIDRVGLEELKVDVAVLGHHAAVEVGGEGGAFARKKW